MVKKTIVNVLILTDENGRTEYLREDDNRVMFLGGLAEEVIRDIQTDHLYYVQERRVDRECSMCKGYGECSGAHEDRWGPTCPRCKGYGFVDSYTYQLEGVAAHELHWRLEEPYSWHEELVEF